MSRRPVFHQELGTFFREMRLGRKLGLRQAAQIASQRGLTAITRQVLFALEKGKTKNPEPDVLRGLADLYELKYEELAAEFIRYRYGLVVTARDQFRHSGAKGSSSRQGEGELDVPASARIQQERRTRDTAFAEEISAVIARLTSLSTALVENRAITPTKASSRRSDRKTRG